MSLPLCHGTCLVPFSSIILLSRHNMLMPRPSLLWSINMICLCWDSHVGGGLNLLVLMAIVSSHWPFHLQQARLHWGLKLPNGLTKTSKFRLCDCVVRARFSLNFELDLDSFCLNYESLIRLAMSRRYDSAGPCHCSWSVLELGGPTLVFLLKSWISSFTFDISFCISRRMFKSYSSFGSKFLILQAYWLTFVYTFGPFFALL